MSAATVSLVQPGIRKAAEAQAADGGNMYAVAFDMDTESLQQHYGAASYNNAYADIRKVLLKHGFIWQQGSVYFGGDQVNAVTCVLAVMDVSSTFPWFALSVRDIRMLRIEEFNDLMPAVLRAAGE
ncbi:MAG TPA: virulence factor [Planctomycetia bacterium]|nr:virulence factor [Planctomycetia bacterium]